MTIAPELKITKTPGEEYTHRYSLEIEIDYNESISVGEALVKAGFERGPRYDDAKTSNGKYVHTGKTPALIEFRGKRRPQGNLMDFVYNINTKDSFVTLDVMNKIRGAVKSKKYEGSD